MTFYEKVLNSRDPNMTDVVALLPKRPHIVPSVGSTVFIYLPSGVCGPTERDWCSSLNAESQCERI